MPRSALAALPRCILAPFAAGARHLGAGGETSACCVAQTPPCASCRRLPLWATSPARSAAAASGDMAGKITNGNRQTAHQAGSARDGGTNLAACSGSAGAACLRVSKRGMARIRKFFFCALWRGAPRLLPSFTLKHCLPFCGIRHAYTAALPSRVSCSFISAFHRTNMTVRG